MSNWARFDVLRHADPGAGPIPASCRRFLGGGFFTEQEPDFLLTEIHRQARDNPIIKLAMQVREGKEIMYGDYGTAQVISRNEINQTIVLEADQVLVGTNKTRRRYNQRLRELKGFSLPYPQSGDKLVCLRNDPAKGLLNGSLWQVMSSSRETVKPGINLMIQAGRRRHGSGCREDQAVEAGLRGGGGDPLDDTQAL